MDDESENSQLRIGYREGWITLCALLVDSICLAVVSAKFRTGYQLDSIGSSNEDDSSAAILASVRMLKQFEKDGIKWEKLAKEIAQK